MKKIKACVLLIAIIIAPAAFAADADKLATILDQQRTLAADMDAGETREMTPRQLNAVRRAQKEVFALTEGKSSLDDLSIDEKVALENALERINAEVKGGRLAKDEQQVCWREHTSGSQVKSTRCGTEAERREAREGARDWMEKAKICVPPGCGG